MTFCFAPWSNLDISPQGIISPCCKFRHEYYPDPPQNINQHKLIDYTKSQTLGKVRNEFLAGQWPKGCERCRIEEENNVKSKRQLDYERWQHHYDSYDIQQGGILTASVAFGNTCNLTCITCGPHSSSRWQKEHRALYQQDVPPNHFYRDNFVHELLDHAPGIVHLDVPGGEPFLSGVTQQQELLQILIDQGRAGSVTIHYTTNVTVWPDQKWWDLWQHFREIDIQLSLDGIGKQFEYIRYPANWRTVEELTKKYQYQSEQRSGLRISVSHTVNAYNIYYLPEFLDWCDKMKLPRPWLGRVHNPAHMRPSVWGHEIRELIIKKLRSGNSDSQTWADLIAHTDNSEHFDLFKNRVKWHDRYRGLDFGSTFPELSPYI
jgi:MoaA/NifB/PqqE/SkfB family radical SAM enzyme